jgi:hypothetical protein
MIAAGAPPRRSSPSIRTRQGGRPPQPIRILPKARIGFRPRTTATRGHTQVEDQSSVFGWLCQMQVLVEERDFIAVG